MSVIDVLRRFATPVQTPSTLDETIAALEPFRDDIVCGLIEALRSDEELVQLLALQVIQVKGTEIKDAVPVIVPMLQWDDRCVQVAAASALGSIGHAANGVLPQLERMLDSDHEYTSYVAACSILEIDRDSETALSFIFSVLNNEVSPHKCFAANFLGHFGCAEAVADLHRLIDDEDAGVRSEASLAIWRITGDSSVAVAVGHKMLDDSDWLVRRIGVEHFQELFREPVVECIEWEFGVE